MDKIVAIYKPQGATSFDVVSRVRRITGEKKVGHAGTLDPLAEGVLVVGIGAGTKKMAEHVAKEKEYQARVCLGATTATDDREGDITRISERVPEENEVVECVRSFVGNIKQKPPVYSAIKVKGVPAYKRVRRGEEVSLGLREVEIKEIEILSYVYPEIELRIVTGPGVYIRSFARDIGACLNVGGYLKGLVRTRVGEYGIANALAFDELEENL
jgi:tRNA pseudouridine55 synthase